MDSKETENLRGDVSASASSPQMQQRALDTAKGHAKDAAQDAAQDAMDEKLKEWQVKVSRSAIMLVIILLIGVNLIAPFTVTTYQCKDTSSSTPTGVERYMLLTDLSTISGSSFSCSTVGITDITLNSVAGFVFFVLSAVGNIVTVALNISGWGRLLLGLNQAGLFIFAGFVASPVASPSGQAIGVKYVPKDQESLNYLSILGVIGAALGLVMYKWGRKVHIRIVGYGLLVCGVVMLALIMAFEAIELIANVGQVDILSIFTKRANVELMASMYATAVLGTMLRYLPKELMSTPIAKNLGGGTEEEEEEEEAEDGDEDDAV